jgi:manganese/zinc/iron transport system permease protein
MISAVTAYFTDAILRAPTLGSMLMGLAAGLVGTLAVLRREALVGEVLSHAAYPGLILGLSTAAVLAIPEEASNLAALMGGTITALVGIWIIHWLEKSLRIPSDAALCLVLAGTFGCGITLASHLQFSDAVVYRKASILLYGQAATMTDLHVWLYGGLVIAVASIFMLFYKEIQLVTFDRPYALSLGIWVKTLEALLFTLIALTVIIGIRTVGVVLMSAMLIAPPVAARQFTDRLAPLLMLSGMFGLLAGFWGNYLSVEISHSLATTYPGLRLTLPTGPTIALTATAWCIIALLFAPQRGLLARAWRIARFRYVCLQENILKFIWRHPQHSAYTTDLASYLGTPIPYLRFVLRRLSKQGWISPEPDSKWHLTREGTVRAAKIVRLHRLWEVYLVDYLGVGAERVHRNAEEMEHIITPALEAELTTLLANPQLDPHHQPIPPAGLKI